MLYGGIDNGNRGALVLVSLPEYKIVEAYEMPVMNVGKGKQNKWIVEKGAVVSILGGWLSLRQPLFVVLEKAQPMPKQGVTSTFKTGRDYGIMEMALLALGIPHEIVPGQTWQSQVLKGIEGGDTKARAILKAQRTFPDLNLMPGRKRKPHDGLADATCMAIYATMLRPPVNLVRKKTPPPPP